MAGSNPAIEDQLREQQRRRMRRLLRNFAIELVVYGALVALYAAIVLQFLDEPIHRLFEQNTTLYAAVALALVVAQAVVLEWLTSFLLDKIGLERLH